MTPTRREFLGAAIATTAAMTAATPAVAASTAFSPDFATALDAAAAIKAKRISSVELTELAFRRVDHYNPKINAVILEFRASVPGACPRGRSGTRKKAMVGTLPRRAHHRQRELRDGRRAYYRRPSAIQRLSSEAERRRRGSYLAQRAPS